MSIFGELKRRNVFRVGVAYVITAWLMLQVVDVVGEIMGVPEWIPKAILLLLIVGFPIALLFAWAFELTPEGLKFERDVDRSASITHSTGRRLNFAIIGILSVALLLFALDKFVWSVPPADAFENRRSIAVLPFENMSGDPEQLYFSDGISEEILNSLVRVPGISVASRTSSFNYRGGDLNIPRIADELGVLFVLEGSVRKSGDQLRITAQLIDAGEDRHLWSESYDRRLEDIFEIQSDIANAIALSIQQELDLESTSAIPTKTLTSNMSAYDSYLKGLEVFTRRILPEDVLTSIAYLERAVQLDPGFAVAWQYLAAAYGVYPFYTMKREDLPPYLERSDAAAERAISLDPELAFAHTIKASNMTVQPPYDQIGALREYDIAIEKDPKELTTHNWRGIMLGMAGYIEEAEESQRRCFEIDPAYWNCISLWQETQIVLNKQDSATAYDEILLERTAASLPTQWVPFYLMTGDRSMALLTAATIPALKGSPSLLWVRALENPDADHSEAWREYREWAESANVNLELYPDLVAAFGQYEHVHLDNVASAWMWYPVYSRFRESDRFKVLMRKFGFYDLWKARGFPEQCRPIGDDDFECD